MNKFAKHVLSVAVAGAFSGITLSALAETDAEQNINDQSSVLSSDETIEEVVAVGVIFEGQAKALDTQRNSDRILNVISADGIGKLPDRNAAEAVQRLPGVSIERDQGEGRFVAVRGLNGAVEYNFDNGDSIYARTLYGTLIDDETHYKHRYRFDKQTQNPDGSIDGGRVELQHIHNILTTELTTNEIGGEHFVGTDSKLDWKLATYDNHFYYGDVPNSSDNSYFVAKFTQKDVVFDGLQYDEDGEGRFLISEISRVAATS